jgi:hypothetical protein
LEEFIKVQRGISGRWFLEGPTEYKSGSTRACPFFWVVLGFLVMGLFEIGSCKIFPWASFELWSSWSLSPE